MWSIEEQIPRPDPRLIREYYVPFASWLADHVDERPVIVGLNGAPGTGKSTLCRLLCALLQRVHGLHAVTLSLDDLYLSSAARTKRAESIHPLLATRGVPGTHDVGLGVEVFGRFRSGHSLTLPSFDKSRDDRRPVERWPTVGPHCDLLLFEGWCVGARAQSPHLLKDSINPFERDEDPDGAWRWYVNRQLRGSYQRLFSELDLLVMLIPPDFEHVFRWREQQESQLRARGGGPNVMTTEQVRRFVMAFERLTRFAWEEMPARADAVVRLGDDHLPLGVELQDP